METIRIVQGDEFETDETRALHDSINRYNVVQTGRAEFFPVVFFLRNDADAVRGGLVGYVWGDWMRIDVLWVERNRPVAAFEIESTTAIYSGLLRMSDLLALQPGVNLPLYLVAPDDRRHLVFREIRRPTFTRMETPLHRVCRYLSFSALEEAIERFGDGVRYMRPEFLNSVAEDVPPRA